MSAGGNDLLDRLALKITRSPASATAEPPLKDEEERIPRTALLDGLLDLRSDAMSAAAEPAAATDERLSRRRLLAAALAAGALAALRKPHSAGATQRADCYDACVDALREAHARDIESKCDFGKPAPLQFFFSAVLASGFFCVAWSYQLYRGSLKECSKPDCGRYGPVFRSGGSIGSVVIPPPPPQTPVCPPNTYFCAGGTDIARTSVICCYQDSTCCSCSNPCCALKCEDCCA